MKIPLLFLARPSVVRLDKKECEIKIPLNWLTRNHVGSMYFGALAMGADCAGGLIAMEAIKSSGKKINLLFKDFQAQFLKRAEADVHFACVDGDEIQKQVKETLRSKKRVNRTVTVTAMTPKVSGTDPVAIFQLTLSLKAKD
jgi:acyl-coenzyme A thioesterase PaaI-like protein